MRAQIEKCNASYKVATDQYCHRVVFEKGDHMWVYLQKECFPIGAHPKLRQRKIGLCRVLRQINDNAYQIKLPSDLNISDIFNITYLSPLYGDDSNDHNPRLTRIRLKSNLTV